MKTIRAVLVGGATPDSVVADAGWTVLRFAAGLAMALAHGWGKLPPSARFVEGVANMGFPAPGVFAWMAGVSEFVGGLLLAAGLLTRPAAFFILGTMAVAFFGRHGADPFTDKEKAFLYGVVAIAFVLSGAGRFSVDRYLRGAGRRA